MSCQPAHPHRFMVVRKVIFVYGALRSGTTLFRLMLQAAPSISNPGEADFLFDYIAPNPGGGWQYDRASLSEDRMFHVYL